MDFTFEQDQNATIDVEKNILGNYLYNNDVRQIITIKLNPKDFLNNLNRQIFVIMKSALLSNDDIDENIIRTNIINGYYEEKEQLLKRLSEISLEFSYTDNIDVSIDYLTKASIINKLKKFYDSEIKYLDKDISIDDLENYLEKKQTEFLNIINSRVTSDLKPISSFVGDFKRKQEIIRENQGKITGINTGLKGLNDYLNGFQPGELIILAARPSIGKTALAINFALNAANKHKDKKIVIYSLEMSADQLIQRMVSVASGINYRDFQEGKIDSTAHFSWYRELDKIGNLDIDINDNMNSTILDIQAGLRDLRNKANSNEIGLVIIDYLQLINSHEKNVNRNQEVAKISRTLKMIAKEFNIPVIAVAQLSRNIEQRSSDDRTPKLSDLRESGAIEQDADVVMFLDYERTQVNNDDKKEDESNVKYASNVVVDLIIAKNRNGETGIIKVNFNKRTGSYKNH